VDTSDLLETVQAVTKIKVKQGTIPKRWRHTRGFPLALEISRKGYNVFVLRYRIGSEQWAAKDLAAAIE